MTLVKFQNLYKVVFFTQTHIDMFHFSLCCLNNCSSGTNLSINGCKFSSINQGNLNESRANRIVPPWNSLKFDQIIRMLFWRVIFLFATSRNYQPFPFRYTLEDIRNWTNCHRQSWYYALHCAHRLWTSAAFINNFFLNPFEFTCKHMRNSMQRFPYVANPGHSLRFWICAYPLSVELRPLRRDRPPISKMIVEGSQF
jgi:hypothetical protein